MERGRRPITWTYAIGWSLVHFLWQGALVAGVAAVLLALCGRRSPALRYAVSVGALLAMAALPLGTAVRLATQPAAPALGTAAPIMALSGPAPERTGVTAVDPATAETRTGRAGQPSPQAGVGTAPGAAVGWLRPRLERALPSLVWCWIVGVLALSLRLLGGWAWARRLTTTGVRPGAESYLAMVRDLAARLRISRPVRLLESTMVQVPAVVGWLRPTLAYDPD